MKNKNPFSCFSLYVANQTNNVNDMIQKKYRNIILFDVNVPQTKYIAPIITI